MDPQELVPLEGGTRAWPVPRKPSLSPHTARVCLRGPLRLCRLLLLMILLPSLFIFVPLYLRYRVFSGQMYPMSMTDMRLIDSKISTTWCQRQVVRSNATFNAFVVPGPPLLTDDLVPVSMTRELELEDDMKEYWGFYLLKGSTVTVSACTRWPGASLIMIKGYKHLQECAYIGDDSSEELDELLEAHQLGLLDSPTLLEKLEQLKKNNGNEKANNPGTMKRHKAGVSFHDPSHMEPTDNGTQDSDSVPTADVTDHDPKELREILERLHALRQAAKTELFKHYKPPEHLMSVPALHRHRDANVDRDERKWLSFKDIDGNNSEQATTQIQSPEVETATTATKLSITATKLNDTTMHPNGTTTHPNDLTSKLRRTTTKRPETTTFKSTTVKTKTEDTEKQTKKNKMSESNVIVNESVNLKNNKVNERKINKESSGSSVKTAEKSYVNENKYVENSPTGEEVNSKEVFEDVLRRLEALGERGKRVLVRLHETMGVTYRDQPSGHSEELMGAVRGSSEELDRLRQVLVEAIDEERTRPQRQQKRRDARSEARAKRELMLGQVELTRQLNEDDEPRNYAAEEGLEPDGFAEHHTRLNETTAFDMSNSEFWSSFSSSEEALLECDGLILNLPLTPHSQCVAGADEQQAYHAARANALTYRVPANGYYFFVFNSENEVQTNFIKARFDLQKTRYDVARTKLRECTNSTERCDLSLDIFSSQKVVLEVPLRDNDSLWNEQFVIMSECEPRTSVYLVCVIAVPILILVFAFQ